MHPKAALVPHSGQQFGQRIVAMVSGRSAFVDTINNQIRFRELMELHRVGRKHVDSPHQWPNTNVAARPKVPWSPGAQRNANHSVSPVIPPY
jgi:hypothetical protein